MGDRKTLQESLFKKIRNMDDDSFMDFYETVEQEFSKEESGNLFKQFLNKYETAKSMEDLKLAVCHFLDANECTLKRIEIKSDEWISIEYDKPNNGSRLSYSFYDWDSFLRKY